MAMGCHDGLTEKSCKGLIRRQKMKTPAKRVMILGATGTVGQATAQALVTQGYDVVCFGRTKSEHLENATFRRGDVTQAASIRDHGFCGEKFDVVVSCLASRNGDPKDAWAIDHQAHLNILTCAKEAGVKHFVLVSAICVQKPKLQFQFAKLAFENELIESGLTYSIVRPTALFKSLSGQIDRLRKGKSFLLFGYGALTACKPISDEDLAAYLVRCIDDKNLQNRILPIGGPGPAITPRQQGEELFRLLNRKPSYTHMPVALFDTIITGLSALGVVIPSLKAKAEFARIGRYYATESMLVWNPSTNSYDAAATPSTGTRSLFDHYADVIKSNAVIKQDDHSVF
jgi:divinyl chlorophyllide a 8-vinyl-reductase